MGFWSKLLGPKRNDAAAREAVIKALIDLQVEISQVVYPSPFGVTLREPEIMASIAMAAIINTTPLNTAEQKAADLEALMDVLLGAIGTESILDQDEQAQAEFQKIFMERWQLYLLPIGLLLRDTAGYRDLDEPLIVLLCRTMNIDLGLVEQTSLGMKLEHRISEAADMVWPALQY